MQTSAAEQAVYRGTNYRPKKWLSIAPREGGLNGTIKAIHIDSYTGSVYELIIEGASGAQGIYGQTIDIGLTPGGHEVGKVRCRSATDDTDPDNTIVPIALTAPGEFETPLAIGQYVTVRLEYRPWQIGYTLKETFDGDGVLTGVDELFDYNIDFGAPHTGGLPKANIVAGLTTKGEPILIQPAAFEDTPGCGYRTVTFDSVLARAMTYGSTVASLFWVWTNGTQPSGTITDAAVTLRLGVGFQYVSLYIVDSDGYSNWMHFPIWVHSADYMPLSFFSIGSDDTDDGRVQTFTFSGDPGSADQDVIPEGCTICYWEQPAFALGDASASYRTHSLGWVTQDAPLLRVVDPTYTISVGGMAWWLDHLDAGTQALRDGGATLVGYFLWHPIDRNRSIWFSLSNYCTASQIVNFFFSDETMQTTDRFNLPSGSILNQGQAVTANFGMSVMRCDSFGNVFVELSYVHRSAAQRIGIEPLLDLFAYDIDGGGIALTTRQSNEVSQVSAAGDSWDGTNEVLYASLAPGTTASSGTTSKKLPGQTLPLGIAQKRLNTLCGRELGDANNDQPSVSVTLLDNLDVVEPAWERPIRVTWEEDTLHGRTLTQALFMVKKVTVAHNNDNDPSSDSNAPAKIITWDLAKVTSGADGQTQPVVTQSPGVTQPLDDVCADLVSAFSMSAPDCDGSVTFTDESTGDIVRRYWVFSDETFSTDASPTRVFAPGTYGVRLYVIDSCDNYAFSEQAITILAAPVASFTISRVGKTVTITDTSVSPGTITDWAYDFGDGNTSTDQNPVHTYAAAGDFDISLVVTDDCPNTSAPAEQTVTIPVTGVSTLDLTASDGGSDWTDQNPTGAAMTWVSGMGWQSNTWSATNHEYARLEYDPLPAGNLGTNFVVYRIEFDYTDPSSSGLTRVSMSTIDFGENPEGYEEDRSVFGTQTFGHDFTARTVYSLQVGIEHFAPVVRIYLTEVRVLWENSAPF